MKGLLSEFGASWWPLSQVQSVKQKKRAGRCNECGQAGRAGAVPRDARAPEFNLNIAADERRRHRDLNLTPRARGAIAIVPRHRDRGHVTPPPAHAPYTAEATRRHYTILDLVVLVYLRATFQQLFNADMIITAEYVDVGSDLYNEPHIYNVLYTET